ALASIERARHATEEGWFKAEIAPVIVTRKKQQEEITADEGPFSINPEKIPKLSPVFQANGTITAANASSLADGAAILILTTESRAQKAGIKPLATIIGHYNYAHEPAWF